MTWNTCVYIMCATIPRRPAEQSRRQDPGKDLSPSLGHPRATHPSHLPADLLVLGKSMEGTSLGAEAGRQWGGPEDPG